MGGCKSSPLRGSRHRVCVGGDACEVGGEGQLLRFLDNLGVHAEPEVLRFGFIGKKSSAHELAIAVRRGKRQPDHRVTSEELWALLG